MCDFTQIQEDIQEQIKLLWNAYDKKGFYEDAEKVIEDFKHLYGYDENSIHYYDIDWELLNDSYREGSVWVISKVLNAYGGNIDYVTDLLTKMSKDNHYYLQQIIYWNIQDIDIEIMMNFHQRNFHEKYIGE